MMTKYNHADAQPRDREGRWAETGATKPLAAVSRFPRSYEDKSLSHPEPEDFDGTPEQYVEYWENAPVSTAQLRYVQLYYNRSIDEYRQAKFKEGYAYPGHAFPEEYADVVSGKTNTYLPDNSGHTPEWYDLRERAAFKWMESETERTFPVGKATDPAHLESHVRAIQAKRHIDLIGGADSPAGQEALNRPFLNDRVGEGESIESLVKESGYDHWQENMLDQMPQSEVGSTYRNTRRFGNLV